MHISSKFNVSVNILTLFNKVKIIQLSYKISIFLQVMGFTDLMVAVFIATVGILSVCAQIVLGFVMRSLGPKHTIMVGLVFEMFQLMWYGFGSQIW